MKRKILFMLAILICGLMNTTCDILKDVVKAPVLTLDSVDFTNINFDGLTLLSKVNVQNDNSITVPLPKIDWDLLIIDNPFVNGVIQSDGSLKAGGSTQVQFPVSFTYVDLINAITSLTDDNAKYKINMLAHIPVPELGDMSWPFSHDGKVPLMRVPDINVLTAPKATLTGGTIPTGGKIDFALNLKNKSNVAVLIKELSCTLKIGNHSLPKGGVTVSPTINAGETGTIPISVSLSASDIVNIGTSVLTGTISNYSLTGDYKFGIPEFPLVNEFGDSFTIIK